MVCMMYESCLMLANAESMGRYNVMVSACLATASIEETDNGKGERTQAVRTTRSTDSVRSSMPHSALYLEISI